MKKKLILAVILLAGAFHQMNAQEAKKFRFDVRVGYAGSSELGDGILLALEPKWSLNEKVNIGLRVAGAGFLTNFTLQADDIVFREDRLSGSGSYTGTVDYYFAHKDGSSFAAFAGGGLGLYNSFSVIGDADDDDLAKRVDTDGSFGGFVRLGFDYHKFRLSAEYNLISEGNVRNFNNNVVGPSKNSYYGISLGFYFGGGKWKHVGNGEE